MLNVMTPVIQLEPRSLRQLLGQYATGITVVTALDVNQRKIGMTANSFTSVSLDPRLFSGISQSQQPILKISNRQNTLQSIFLMKIII